MIRDTLLLFQLNYDLARKTLRSAKAGTVILWIIGVIVAGGMAVLSFAIGSAFGAFVRQQPQYAPLFPGLLLTGAVLLLLLIGFGNALTGLFLSSDLETLMVAPVDRRAVFVYKILNGMSSAYLLIFILALPAVISFGITLRLNLLYYLLSFIALMGAPLFSGALGSLLAMLLARFAPMNRVREIFGAFASLMGFACWIISQIPRLLSGSSATASRQNAVAFEATLRGLLNAPIPTIWAGKGIIAAGHNQFGVSLLQLGLYLLLTFGTFAVVVIIADQLYATGWLRMQSSGIAHRKVQRVRSVGMYARYPVELALALKDWRLRLRDLRLLVQMLSGVIIIVLIYVGIFNSSSSRSITSNQSRSRGVQIDSALQGTDRSVQAVILCATITAAGILLVTNVAVTSFSMEGKSLWILKVAPVSAWQVLRGKLTAVGLPFFIITTILFVIAAIMRQLNPVWALYGWFGIETLGIGALSFKVALCLPWANLNWVDPGKMNAGIGGCLAELGAYAYAIIGGLILCIPLVIERVNSGLLPVFILLSVVLVSLITTLLVGVSMSFAASRWLPLGETA